MTSIHLITSQKVIKALSASIEERFTRKPTILLIIHTDRGT